MTHGKNIVELEGVSFGYTKDLVLENINLEIHQGDYLGVVGPNGGGKTTLLKIMLGLLKPDQGRVMVFDQPIQDFRKWWRVGYVPQRAVNFDSLFPATALEVTLMGRFAKRGLLRPTTAEDREKASEALEKVDMLKYASRRISDLSGGQQQRVFIARALATEPEVIFLDEPTAGVDALSQRNFYELLHRLNREMGLTLVHISHDVGMLAHHATELAHVNRHITYHGDPEEFSDLKKLISHQH